MNKISSQVLNSLTDTEGVPQGIVPGDPKKYSCLIKRKMHNERGIFKIKIVLNYQCDNSNFDILVLIFGCYLAEI